MKSVQRHADFEKIYQDFRETRNGELALVLYLRFLDHYGLDESRPYHVGAQSRLREAALNSPMHQDIKKRFPMFGKNYWDSFLTKIQKARGRRIKIRSDHSILGLS